MSHDLDRFWRILLLTNAAEVELSVLIGVGGYGCPNAIKQRRMNNTS